MHVQMAFSYARTEEEAIEGAFDQWRSNLASLEALENFGRPEQYDEATKNVTREDLKKKILISTEFSHYIERIDECIQLGFENIILHNVNRSQKEFINDFGSRVLPALNNRSIERDTSGASVIT